MTYTNHIRVMDAAAKPARERPTADPTPAEPVETKASLAVIFCVFLFLLAQPTEMGIWYWAGVNGSSLNTQGIRSAIPQYLLSAILPFAVIFHVNSCGFKYYARAVGVFLPFLAIGLISGLQGLFPLFSIRLLVAWVACASICVIVAGGLSQRQAVRLVFYVVLLEIILSIVLALFFKSAGVMPYNRAAGGIAWRGLFAINIALGMMAAWGAVLSLLRKFVGWPPTLAMLGCAMICLYEAHSAGAMFALVCSMAFAGVVLLLRRSSLSTISKVIVLGLGTVTALTVVVTVVPLILAALGRDPTLTGRTEIWQLYIPAALQHPILGQGPGSFSAPSDVTAALFYRLTYLGAIRTPHSMYIALFGEVGALGLAAELGALFYIAFVLPFKTPNSVTLACSAGAILAMTEGLVEVDMLYAPTISLFIILFLFAIRGKSPE
jgi:O-antigen ligase